MTDEDAQFHERLAALYRDAAAGLMKHATVLVGRDAEDLVNTVFERAWRQRQDVLRRSLDGQRAWAYRVLRNKIIDLFRGHERDHDLLEEIFDRLDRHPRSTASKVFLSEKLQQCSKVIDSMPTKRRRVLQLLALEWEAPEIATLLGITQSTVRSHIQAGRETLNDAIGPSAEIFIDLTDEQHEDGGEQ